MLNQNLKTIRKNKGFTQEDLANRLHVTRQTISKWEKGYSVPDADMLTKIADELDVSVSDLLGNEKIAQEKSDSLSEQLARINEQLSIKNRRAKRIWRTVIILVIAFFIVIPGAITLFGMYFSTNLEGAGVGYAGATTWVYQLDGKEYECRIEYDKKYRIVSTDADAYIEDNIKLYSYSDANEAGKAIESYFEKHGGKEVSKEVQEIPLKE